MANKGVAIRLGTEGKAQVKSDFAEVRQAGERAFEGIAASAETTTQATEAQINRWTAGLRKLDAEEEALQRRRERTVAKLQSVESSGQLPLFGGGLDAGADEAQRQREAAAIARENIALGKAQEAQAAALRAIIDPLAAAQARYNTELAETRSLQAAGKITAEELAQYELVLKQRLEESVAANDNAARATGAHRAGLQQLGFQASDFFVQISSGTDAVRAFSLQAPQAIQAIALMGHGAEGAEGKFAKFAAFMGSGYGAAITVAVALAGTLATSLFKSGDAADEGKSALERLTDRLDLSKNSYEALIAVLNEYKKTQADSNQITYQAAAAAEAAAKGKLHDAEAELARLKAMNPQAFGDVSGASMGIPGAVLTGDQLRAANIGRVQALIDSLNADLAKAGIITGTEATRRATDERYRIEAGYNAQLVALDERRTKQLVDQTTYEREQLRLTQAKIAALKAYDDAHRSTHTPSASAQASVGDMSALLQTLLPGVAITSTTGGRHTQGSDHYAGRAIDFVPQGGMAGWTKERMLSLLQEAGVTIRRNQQGVLQFFGPGDRGHDDHFHVAWSGTASPESAQRLADRRNDEAVRRQRDYDTAIADLAAREMQSRRAALTDVDAIARFEHQQVLAETAKYDLTVNAKVALGDLTEEQGRELMTRRALVANLDNEAIERGKLADLARQAAQLERDAKSGLGAGKAEVLKGSNDKDRGPLASYLRGLGPGDADRAKQQIYERAQGFAVDELEYFRKGINDAITEKLGIKDPFLSQLIDLFLEQWLIKPITAAMEKAAEGGGGSGLGAFISGVSQSITHFLGGNAVGTENFSGGLTWLAENGPELVSLPRGAKVTPAAQTRRILGGANDNRPIVIQQFDYANAVMTADLMREMDVRADAAARQATRDGIGELLDKNQRSHGRLLQVSR